MNLIYAILILAIVCFCIQMSVASFNTVLIDGVNNKMSVA